MAGDCPFCKTGMERSFHHSELAFALYDNYPVSPGHALIVPRRHFASWADATEKERSALWTDIEVVRELVQKKYHPDGINIGINDGVAAGQTIMHLHVHIIPRYAGDVEDPRGGIRWVIPGKAAYWEKD